MMMSAIRPAGGETLPYGAHRGSSVHAAHLKLLSLSLFASTAVAATPEAMPAVVSLATDPGLL
jgi:hypothetical protein